MVRPEGALLHRMPGNVILHRCSVEDGPSAPGVDEGGLVTMTLPALLSPGPGQHVGMCS
jgi:hypothetical protein